MKNRRIYLRIAILVVVFIALFATAVHAEPGISITEKGIQFGETDNPKDVSSTIQVLLVLTVLSLAPSILIMMTSFTRIIIILSFLRNALGTQQMPPNQVLIGLALFLTLFIMTPIGTRINDEAFQPYSKGTITQQAALDKSSTIIKTFMLKQFRKGSGDELDYFMKLGKVQLPQGLKSEELEKKLPEILPLRVVVPAFMINELTVAFKIGFLIFIPFLVIDMVVSSTLMSMGMMMLPPVMISLPFKVLLFIMVGGWGLMVQTIVSSFKF